MSYPSNKRARRIKPFARATSFDYNVRFDIQHYQSVKYNRNKNPAFPPTQADSAMSVMEGEILVKKAANAQYTNSQLHVFSFANGLSAPADAPEPDASIDWKEDGDTDAKRSASVLLGVKYMGVAVTGFNPGSDQYQQGFVATIAGLNTLFNNGQNTLHPGDTLCMDLPPQKTNGKQNRALQGGVPREKVQFVLTTKEKFDERYKAVAAISSSNYIVGTCISYARPGDSVDVILHRVNHTIEKAAPAGGEDGAAGANPGAGGGLQPGPIDVAVGEPRSSKKSKKR